MVHTERMSGFSPDVIGQRNPTYMLPKALKWIIIEAGVTSRGHVIMNACKTDEDYAALAEASRDRPVFLLKHSTRCPGSRAASIEFQKMEEYDGGADYWLVLVIENRELSMKIAKTTGIDHESPQVLLFSDAKVVWHASHCDIGVDNMKKALSSV